MLDPNHPSCAVPNKRYRLGKDFDSEEVAFEKKEGCKGFWNPQKTCTSKAWFFAITQRHIVKGKDIMDSSPDSSFEVMDPHDPTLSRMATLMCRKTNEYLQAEIANGRDHHSLLEEINQLVIPKYTDLRNLTENLNRTLRGYNTLYLNHIQPLLSEIDNLHAIVAKLEENAYRLDNYTKQLKTRAKDMNDPK